ncbi:MAG: LysR family transcriptional regulator [Lachnospiraceae bacterium]|nr:LysR family transcriptional regulator [Lachnospiraceae bacterium]
MEIEFLREFIVLSETCSFQEASEQLYITNSTLSKHIQKMEAELGHPLFERSTRRVTLTEMGHILQESAGKILAQYDEALIQMNKEAAKATNTLSVAFTNTTFRYGVLDTILAFKQEYPEINLQIAELQGPLQKSTFLDRQVEFIFTGDKSWTTKDISHHIFAKEEVVLVTSADNPLAEKSVLSLSEIADEQLLLPDRAFLQDLLFDACTKAGFTPKVRMYTNNTQTAFQLAANNYASAIFPRSCLGEYTGSKEVRAVTFYPEITFEVYMLYMANRPFSSAGELFFDYVTAYGRGDQ